MIAAKMDDHAIVAALQAEGIRQPNGKPMDKTWVGGIRYSWKEVPDRQNAYAEILMPRHRPGVSTPIQPRPVVVAQPVPKPEPDSPPRSRFGLPLSVDRLLADKEVGAAERLQVLLVFVDISDTARALLADEKLTVEQRIAVIEAVGTARKKESQ
jgi:hypothetical protein